MIEIRMTAGLFDKICDHIFLVDGLERMSFAFLNSSKLGKQTLLTGCQYYLPEDKDYQRQGGCSVSLRLEKLRDILNDCIRNGLSLIDIHSHPFSGGDGVSFSGIDDDYEKRFFDILTSIPIEIRKNIFEEKILNNLNRESYKKKLLSYYAFNSESNNYILSESLSDDDKKRIKRLFRYAGYSRINYKFYLCTMVVNRDRSYDLRCYKIWNDSVQKIKVSKIKFPGLPYRIDYPNKKKTKLTKAKKEILNRQILAFGEEGQSLFSDLSVAIVGVGGLGSLLAENLCRLGIGKMVLIEPDNSDFSNLNRFSGMKLIDARLQTPKVEVTGRYLTEINPDIELSLFHKSVYSEDVNDYLKGVDVILSSTDNASSRYWLNEFATQYLIPLINAGNVIRTDEEGDVVSISAECNVYLPGFEDSSACLLCSSSITPTQVNYEQAPQNIQSEGVRGGYIEGMEINAPSVVHLNGITANFAISELYNLIFNYKKLHRCIVVDMLYNEINNLSVLKNTECNTCSESYGKIGRGDSIALKYFK